MQLKYQATKQDYIQFHNWAFKKHIKEKAIIPIVIISILFAITAAGKPFEWWRFIITLTLSIVISGLVIYLISYLRFLYALKKATSTNEAHYNEKIVNITDEGLTCTYIRTGNNKFFNWDTIASVLSTETMVYISMVDKSISIIPKKYFSSESEITEFISTVIKRIPQKPIWAKKYNKSPSWMAYLCFIPLIGAFVGITLIFNGFFKYKSKRLVIIGFSGIIFTVVIYSSLYFYGNSESGRRGFEPFAKSDLNNLMKNLEFYKMQRGTYPDSLMQLKTKGDFTSINDPLQNIFDKKKNSYYNYQKVGNKYYLFSSGIDGIPNTKDDLYPDIYNIDTSKIGLIIKHHQ